MSLETKFESPAILIREDRTVATRGKAKRYERSYHK
jgi:hypothetical protein